jgi:hypothetical protein
MKKLLLLSLPLVLVALASGCGGSSSETPWPAEPEGPALGPSGETARPGTDDPREAPESDAGEPPPTGNY